VAELFFEAMTRRRQIRRVDQRHGVRLQALPPQQPPHQMLVEGAQSADAHAAPKLMEHPGSGQRAPQPGEAPPRDLFGQLCHDEIERMRGGQHCQQMRAPELGGTQGVPSPARELAGTNLSNEIIGGVRTQQFEQAAGADGRQNQTHARTLTQTAPHATPLVSA
jgi:hypothetical protein